MEKIDKCLGMKKIWIKNTFLIPYKIGMQKYGLKIR